MQMYVTWHKYPTKVVGLTTMQTEGSFISSVAVDITAGGVTPNAPDGAQYATIWADVPFYFQAGANPTPAKDSTGQPYPANSPVQFPDVAALSTKIAGIAI